MAPAAKKLKALTNPSISSRQQSIAAFAKVSKPLSQSCEILDQKGSHTEKRVTKSDQIIPASNGNPKKRKHDETDDESIAITKPKSTEKRASASIPAQMKCIAKGIPAKEIGGVIFPLLTSSNSQTSSTASDNDLGDACCSSPASYASIYCSTDGEDEMLELELADMRELYNAFLNALSLHYAHNGSRSPVDFNHLKPSIERIWGKRGIQITDIQQVIGIAVSEYASTTEQETETIEFPCYAVNGADTIVPVKLTITEPEDSSKPATLSKFPLSLSDYGNGKVCVELSDSLLESNLHSYPINITTLMQKFDKAVDRYKSSGIPAAHLPLAAITPCASLKHVSASRGKTRALVADIKAGAAHVQANNGRNINSSLMPPPAPPLTIAATTSPSDPMDRSNALIARLLAKKSIANQKPTPLSTEVLARKAGFQRLDEVVGILDSLATVQMRKAPCGPFQKKPRGDQTYSFTMAMVVQALQGSMRNPIAKAEVVMCMGLLAEESIGKGYVALKDVTVGHKIGGDYGKVVVVKGGLGVLRGRMQGNV